MAACPDCLFDEAVAAVGREPGTTRRNSRCRSKPGTMAVDALRKVMRNLLDTLGATSPVRADLDSEFLHDLRVATRRTRSALTQVKHVPANDVVSDFRQRFAWLGQVTGPTRDLDVFLLEPPRFTGPACRSRWPMIWISWRSICGRHSGSHRQKLKRELGSVQMRTLLSTTGTLSSMPMNHRVSQAGLPICRS